MKVRIYMITAMLIFGSMGMFVRMIDLSSGQTALARGVIGSLFLIVAGMAMREKLNLPAIRRNLLLLILSGTAIGFNWIFLFEAYKHTTISNATISYYFAPVFVTFLSPFLLREKLSGKKMLAILAAMAGMFLVVGGGGEETAASHLIGIGYGLTAAALYASVILMNKFLKGLRGLETTLIQLLTASLVLLPYIFVTEEVMIFRLRGISLAVLLLLGILHTGFAYLLYFTSMQELKGQTIAVFSYIDPISAILMASVFLAEGMSLWQAAGGILVLGSAFFSEKYA